MGFVVDRDLKPDNILLDERGHAHLTDFNIAVHFTERRALTSVAGSMAYMGALPSLSACAFTNSSSTAPEVLAKRGYFDTVDWWSLGVVAYELLFGKRPFRGKTNSSLTQAILKESLKFPDNAEDVVSADGLDCVRGVRFLAASVAELELMRCGSLVAAEGYEAAVRMQEHGRDRGVQGARLVQGLRLGEDRGQGGAATVRA